ncbi:hypothetical protein lacNasYZ03_17720 [Lactobacillus nasalidis]|uniref:Mub B2-like domain-containing protein n=1 Tax=Lactobacillus nasalidis TaxID=2797258 RepID=A0ABQ3W9R0_9LACO|nr:hypothetical protein [Lactobacillus nasalidis]GHV96971.1 hypothetical protein lacNasYZ01_01530 [Lactobacillus nasalidis]GHV98578.1 hypothetical protein lacNasYZ02_00080 [Lactobacillus nasalidis]GHW02085.1 hypothetical protein lacNasYZ03_17720 [Lactobacillus nasalidis]
MRKIIANTAMCLALLATGAVAVNTVNSVSASTYTYKTQTKKFTRTIKVCKPKAKAQYVKQNAYIKRTVKTNKKTGQKTYGKWSTSYWKAYIPPFASGYVASPSVIGKQKVTYKSKSFSYPVVYSKIQPIDWSSSAMSKARSQMMTMINSVRNSRKIKKASLVTTSKYQKVADAEAAKMAKTAASYMKFSKSQMGVANITTNTNPKHGNNVLKQFGVASTQWACVSVYSPVSSFFANQNMGGRTIFTDLTDLVKDELNKQRFNFDSAANPNTYLAKSKYTKMVIGFGGYTQKSTNVQYMGVFVIVLK